MKYLLVFLAVVVGCLIPVQGAVNSRLGVITGQPLLAALISFAGGTAAIAIIAVAFWGGLPKWDPSGPTPAYLFLGGLPGVAFVLTTLWLVPKIGIAMVLSGLLVGQLSMSLVFDQIGWLGNPVKVVTPQRLAGVVLLVAGALLVVRGDRPVDDARPDESESVIDNGQPR